MKRLRGGHEHVWWFECLSSANLYLGVTVSRFHGETNVFSPECQSLCHVAIEGAKRRDIENGDAFLGLLSNEIRKDRKEDCFGLPAAVWRHQEDVLSLQDYWNRFDLRGCGFLECELV